jgi:DNA-directed RNA polymerase specialized sigma subunit
MPESQELKSTDHSDAVKHMAAKRYLVRKLTTQEREAIEEHAFDCSECAKVREILLDMPLRDRSLLKAIFLDERNRDEVCREFGIECSYLGVLLRRAKQEFMAECVRRAANTSPQSASD